MATDCEAWGRTLAALTEENSQAGRKALPGQQPHRRKVESKKPKSLSSSLPEPYSVTSGSIQTEAEGKGSDGWDS